MAETAQRHSLIWRVLGAAKAAADNLRVSNSLRNMTRGVQQLKAGLLGMRGMMMGFAASLVAVGLGLRRTITAYADYTQAQSRLRTTLAASTDAHRQNARLVGSVAEQAAIRYGYSLTEANDAMTTMIQTGIGVHASMRMFGSTMRLARIAEMDTENATRFLVDTMNMFRGEMADNNYTLREFADTMSGQLAVAANSASTDIEQLQQAFRYAGTEMSALGYSSSEVMSALAGLSVVGLRGTTAGTRLRGAVAALINPSQRVREQIAEITGNTDAWAQIVHDERGTLRSLPAMMGQLMQIMGQLPTQQQRAQLEVAIFGRRALAAGISLSEYNEAARRMLSINEEISNSAMVRRRLYEMERQRMMSFGMQIQQLREGATDLAVAFGEILFGAMDQSGEGFGTYIRNIAMGIRLIGEMNGGNEEAAADFRALSPQVQETARNVRELFTNLANLLRTAWRVISWMADFTQRHPYVVAGIIAMRVAFGGFIPALSGVLRAVMWTGRQMVASMAATTARLQTMSMAGRFAAVGMGLLGVAIVNEAVPAFRDWMMSIAGVEGGLAQLRTSGTAEWLEQNIPLVGNLAAAWVDVYNGLRQAIDAHNEMEARRRATETGVTRAGAEARVQARMTNVAGQRRFAEASDEEIRRRAIGLEQHESQMRLAALLWTQEIRGREAVAQHLAQAGLQGEALTAALDNIVRIQTNQGDALETEARGLVSGIGPFRDYSGATRDATVQLVQFGELLRDLNAQGAGGAGTEGEGAAVPTAEDAYVRQGGLMNVSSGDVVVSRRHLADAILASRGAMAAPAVGAAGERSMAGPAPSAATGGGGEMVVSIPVIIDGREIARANGRANIRQLERGGGRLPPGQRRSLRETGFNRVI